MSEITLYGAVEFSSVHELADTLVRVMDNHDLATLIIAIDEMADCEDVTRPVIEHLRTVCV